MVQKEVAERMQVGPGTKDYGALSLCHDNIFKNICVYQKVLSEFFLKIKIIFLQNSYGVCRISKCRHNTIINEDILKVDVNAIVQKKNGGKPIKVVANLPYV